MPYDRGYEALAAAASDISPHSFTLAGSRGGAQEIATG
jgi:hypothetical protein